MEGETINMPEKNEPSEAQEQMALITWAEYNRGQHPELKLLHHIPNGGMRGKAEAGRFKAMGVKPGVPDLFLPVARGKYHGLYIELKRQKTGKASAAQRGWFEALQEQGYAVVLCHGWVQASEKLVEYLNL